MVVAFFVGCLALYLLTLAGHQELIDVAEELQVAQSIVTHGTFVVHQDVATLGGGTSAGVEHQLYAPHGLGASLLLVPAALVGRFVGSGHDSFAMWWTAWLLNPIIGAATATLILVFAEELGASPGAALCLAILFAVATQEWPATRDAYDVTPTALCLLFALYGLKRFGATSHGAWLVASGVAFALSELIRIPSVIWWPPLAIGLWLTRRNAAFWMTLRRLALWSIPLALVCAIIAWFNWVRYGNPLLTGHGTQPESLFATPLALSIAGYLFSPGKSILLFSPILVLGVIGFPFFWRQQRMMATTILLVVIFTMTLYGKWHNWTGDWAWGPRYMTLILGPVVLSAIPILNRWPQMATGNRIAIACLALFSIAIQIIGVTDQFNSHYTKMVANGTFSQRIWRPNLSEIALGGRDLWQGLVGQGSTSVPDFWWHSDDLWAATHGVDVAFAVFLLAVLVGAAFAVGQLHFRAVAAMPHQAGDLARGKVSGDVLARDGSPIARQRGESR